MFSSTIPGKPMIDIHMHLVPGVDDGAQDMEMALVMLDRARQQGITRIIATPHNDAFDASGERIHLTFRKLSATAAKLCPDVKLYLGCEVFCEAQDMDRILDALRSGLYPTLNGTDSVLMEFSPWVRPEGTVPCVEALVRAGYQPIIAHMERYPHLRQDMALVDRFRELGARIQVNAYSLFDEGEDSIRHWARRLVQAQKADFLGTDAHRTYHRPPSAANGLTWLYENIEPAYANALAWKNALELLAEPSHPGEN